MGGVKKCVAAVLLSESGHMFPIAARLGVTRSAGRAASLNPAREDASAAKSQPYFLARIAHRKGTLASILRQNSHVELMCPVASL